MQKNYIYDSKDRTDEDDLIIWVIAPISMLYQ